MNLFLHGIDGEPGEVCPIETGDSLISDPGTRYDVVMTNPPFGKKSSITLTNGDGKADKEALTYERPRLLGNHKQQTTKLSPACEDASENQR
jgi:type I restriction enzyme M protein